VGRSAFLPPLPVAAAVPDDLTAYGRTATRLADELGHAARRLDATLAAFAATRPVLGSPDRSLAAALSRHALAAGTLGAFVARVGEAFRRADGGHRRSGTRAVRVSEPALSEVLARRANPLRFIVRGDPGAWDLAVNGVVCRAGGTRGGGFITGPDGRRYPIVVPDTGERPDPRWRVVATEDGVADLRARLGAGMKLLLGAGLFGLAANGQAGDGRPAEPDAYADLVPPAAAPTHGSGRARVARPGTPVPAPPPEAPPPIRSGATSADDTVPMPLAVGIVSLAASGAAAARGLAALENQDVVATRVTYETDDRGRRRATVRVWQIYEHDDGSRTVGDSYAYLGPDGKPTLTPVTADTPSLRPADGR
jgi:hypothetical protein